MFNDYREVPLFEQCPECATTYIPRGQAICDECHRNKLMQMGFKFDEALDPDECPFCECTPCVCMEDE